MKAYLIGSGRPAFPLITNFLAFAIASTQSQAVRPKQKEQRHA